MNTNKISYILASISMILATAMLYNGHNWGGDFSQYIAQAIALVEGNIAQQIQNNTWIIQNGDSAVGPFIYPWGFPLLLAPMYAIFGFNFIALKIVGVLCFGAFVFVFHRYCAKFLNPKFAFIATALFALNPLFLSFANNILSDIPYLFFSFLGVVWLSSLFDKSMGGGRATLNITLS